MSTRVVMRRMTNRQGRMIVAAAVVAAEVADTPLHPTLVTKCHPNSNRDPSPHTRGPTSNPVANPNHPACPRNTSYHRGELNRRAPTTSLLTVDPHHPT